MTEQKGVYIVQIIPQSPRPVIRRGKKAMLRGRGCVKMFRGQGNNVLNDLALALVDASTEVIRLRKALSAAEQLLEELGHGQAAG